MGPIHEHKETCFKDVIDKPVRFDRRCRFQLCRFVWLRPRVDDGGLSRQLPVAPVPQRERLGVMPGR